MRHRVHKRRPGINEEELCREQGFNLIAGIDEVGRGCLAGPVVASAVVLPAGLKASWTKQVKDSKLLTVEERERLSPIIHAAAVTVGTGVVDSYIIDEVGMTLAVSRAMAIAVENLLPAPEYLLIDYFKIPSLSLPQKGVKEGDTLCLSIACASIVAKVYRDHLMEKLAVKYPGYGFGRHKGYGTEEHRDCLRKLGPSPIHRRLFGPVKNLAQLAFAEILEKVEKE